MENQQPSQSQYPQYIQCPRCGAYNYSNAQFCQIAIFRFINLTKHLSRNKTDNFHQNNRYQKEYHKTLLPRKNQKKRNRTYGK